MKGGVAVLVLVVDDVGDGVGVKGRAERHEETTEDIRHVSRHCCMQHRIVHLGGGGGGGGGVTVNFTNIFSLISFPFKNQPKARHTR